MWRVHDSPEYFILTQHYTCILTTLIYRGNLLSICCYKRKTVKRYIAGAPFCWLPCPKHFHMRTETDKRHFVEFIICFKKKTSYAYFVNTEMWWEQKSFLVQLNLFLLYKPISSTFNFVIWKLFVIANMKCLLLLQLLCIQVSAVHFINHAYLIWWHILLKHNSYSVLLQW